MSVRDLPSRLRHHPGLTGLAGASSAVLAVPEPALAFVVAGLSQLTGRHPLVVAVPTTPQAERLVHDLEAFLGAGDVDLFPAWETLPFERVSPSVETMGRRLRAMWRLKNPSKSPRVLVAPVRSLMQRLGPHVEEVEPITIRPGDRLDPVDLVERLVAAGYRREVQVEHRGQVARRGSIVDVFPSTADAPVRIDLWGDEVDRLTGFSVGDQRSTHDLAGVELFPSRELLPTDEVRARAAELVGLEPWGREQWERLAEGAVFEGMESWLPWLTGGEHVLFDLLGPDALVLLAEPRRMRDRGADLMAEEASLADSLATTWGARASTSGSGAGGKSEWPRLHLPFDRLLAHTRAPAWTVTSTAEGPDVTAIEARGWDPVMGDSTRLARQVGDLVARGYEVVVAADGRGSAARLAALLSEGGVSLPVTNDPVSPGRKDGAAGSSSSPWSGASSCPRSSWPSSSRATSPGAAAPTAVPAPSEPTPRASSTT